MTIKSIGSAGGRDYATPVTWEADCPANLVTAPDTWEGEMYNDSEFLPPSGVSAWCVIAGMTVDATHNVQLRCASGQSFKDHANKSTNPLRYDQSKGVGIHKDFNYSQILYIQVSYTKVTGIQFKHKLCNSFGIVSTINIGSASGIEIRDCISHGRSATTANCFYTHQDLLVNCLAINEGTASSCSGFRAQVGPCTFINCTAVVPSDVTSHASSNGFRDQYDTNSICKGCASFNFGEDWHNDFGGTGTGYNATDGSSAPGSNNQVSLTYANQFEVTTVSGMDFRLKSGSDLEEAAIQFSQTADLDIVGNARSASTPDIGCWEFQSAASSVLLAVASIIFDEAFGIPDVGGDTVSEILPTGIATTSAFGNAALIPGSVVVTPSGISTTAIVGDPTLVMGAITVLPSSIAATLAFGTTVLTPGSVTVLPSGIASTTTLGTASLGFVLVPAGITATEAFGTPLLTLTVHPSGIAPTTAVGDPVLTGGVVTIVPSGIPSTEVFGTALLIVGAVVVAPVGIASATAFGTLLLTLTVSPAGITATESLGTPALALVVHPAGVATTTVVGDPTVLPGAVVITPNGAASTLAFGTTLVFAGDGTLFPGGIASGAAVGTLLLGLEVTPTGIAALTALGTPALSLVLAPESILPTWLVIYGPDEDITVSGWTDAALGTTDLYTNIDEPVADDADYITSDTGNSVYEARFPPLPEGVDGFPATAVYRFRKTATNNTIQLDVMLQEGAVNKHTWGHFDIGTDWETVEQPITNPISDWSDVRLRFRVMDAGGGGGGGGGGGDIDPTQVSSALLRFNTRFGVPALSLFVSPIGIASGNVLGVPTLIPGPVILVPTGIATGIAFGLTALIVGSFSVEPVGIAATTAFGTTQLNLTVSPTGIASGEAFGDTEILAGSVTLLVVGIDSTLQLGEPQILFAGSTDGLFSGETDLFISFW